MNFGGEVMKYKKIELVPRWCWPEDIQMGWVILHKDIQDKIGIKHLQHVKIMAHGKKIYCRVIGPGSKGKRYLDRTDLKPKEQNEILKESIFMDSYYEQRLNLPKLYPNDKNNGEKIEFKIKRLKILGSLKSSLYHPNDGVKTGTWLGLILGSLSIVLAIGSILIAIFKK
jgi:hypothetical protein